ncbi:MAG TPA: Tim44/TimA family putative adaptor protein [Rhizomicrobium sp.]|nr:Tim44/TimA family putative adaptor protein [Rhizomicrobium sp.]
MPDSQFLLIVLGATVAAILFIRLFAVLGRRTGAERGPSDAYQRRVGGAPSDARPGPAPAKPAPALPGDPVARGLMDIQLADRSFDREKFLAGARQAYETIVTAYAKNDRETLRPLLSAEVFDAFAREMSAREARGETNQFKFVNFRETPIAHAVLRGRRAEVAVRFAARFVSATLNKAGQVIAGDAVAPRDVVDEWTFARDVGSADPNWTLVATAGPEAL